MVRIRFPPAESRLRTRFLQRRVRGRSRQHSKTITIGQTKIEDRRVIVDQLERAAGTLRRAGDVDGEAALGELGLQNSGEAVFILDDQKIA